MTDRGASEFEIKAIRTPKKEYDVAILGGGLAGLTLALHLKRARPETSVLVAEKRELPPPEAAFKVGESTVEVGAYYFRELCGMADHLEERHIRKAGLRFFFPAGGNEDISRRVEFVTPDQYWNHQIDRGRFEAEAFDRAVKLGADAFRGYRVMDVQLDGANGHKVTLQYAGSDATIEVGARWVVDASGRSNILRKKLGLQAETGHDINAAWFRLAGGLDVEDFGAHNQEWVDRVDERGFRKDATVHLLDTGYWVWLIPLSSGAHSIGVCADPRFHPFSEISEFDALMEWFKKHEPQLAAAVEPRRDQVMDFLVIENFSYASTETLNGRDRWTLVGEAGGFIDAFYSPGSDFIGYTDNFSKDLICRDLDGEDIEDRADFYNFFFYQLFDPTISLYKDQYQFFGNPQVMLAKNLYDNTAYFSTLAFMFLQQKMTDLDVLAEVVDQFQLVIPLLGRMQDLFRDWSQIYDKKWEGISILSKHFTPMIEKQANLSKKFTDEEYKELAIGNLELLKALAIWLFFKASESLPEGERPDPERKINALGVSLHPEKWEEEGLYSEDGMTLAEASEQLPGIEEFDLEASGATVAAPA